MQSDIRQYGPVILLAVACSLYIVHWHHTTYTQMLEHEKLTVDHQKLWKDKCTQLGGVVLDSVKMYCVKKEFIIDIK